MIVLAEHFKYRKLTLAQADHDFLAIQEEGSRSSYFKKDKSKFCISLRIEKKENLAPVIDIDTNYFIGVNRLEGISKPFYISSKLDEAGREIDVVKVLFEALQEPENFHYLDDLYEIDLAAKPVRVNQGQDKLSPFVIIHFLSLVKEIVRKGLKKSYYSSTKNLQNRVKGKVETGLQVKQNLVKGRYLNTICTFQEFGTDTTVNRFVKYVLGFCKRYLPELKETNLMGLNDIFNYCYPAFVQVGEQSFDKFTYRESNPFYKLYNAIVALGNLIIKMGGLRFQKQAPAFGYSIPPYWIDMTRLFELYVYKKLRKQFPEAGTLFYHKKFDYQEPDFILNTNNHQFIIDAKYKPRYEHEAIIKEDARQLSGYSRLRSVQEEFGYESEHEFQVIKCLIVYSSQQGEDDLFLTEVSPEKRYIRFYKIGLRLPEVVIGKTASV